MEAALEAGAEDIVTNDDGSIEVVLRPTQGLCQMVKEALEKAGFKPALAEITMKPENEDRTYGRRRGENAEDPRRARIAGRRAGVYTNAVLPE